MKTRYGVSPWIHQFPDSRRPDYPRFKGERSADVVIVGGGLTGCAAAYAFAAAGLKTVLLERDRIGHGSTGRSAGLLLPDPGPAFGPTVSAHGLRAARTAFEGWRRGSLEAAALLRKLKIQCNLEPRQTVIVPARGEEKAFKREYEAREAAGLDVAWLSQRQIKTLMNLDAAIGVRSRDSFTLDPYRACVGMATAARKRGAVMFERSTLKKVRLASQDLEVTTDAGTIRTAAIVVATLTATAEFKPLRRHFTPRETYLVETAPVPAAMRKQLGDRDTILRETVLRDTTTPPYRVRSADEDRLLLAGADQDETPAKTRGAVLVQRTGQLMYELLTRYTAISGLQPEYGWESAYGETADGLMYIGPHRNYPRHLFALGGGRDSVTGAFVAARILLRALQGEPEKADAVFGWAR